MKKSKYIDHTLLKPESTKAQVQKIVDEAKAYDFATVMVNPCWIPFVKPQLEGTDVKAACVIGFPLGANTTAVKVFETTDALNNGADEIDMVLNIGELKDGNDEYVTNEIKAVKEACGEHCLKVIIETCLLTDEEKVRACKDVVATLADVKLMKEAVEGTHVKVKASGGVRTREDFDAMIKAGAERIGTSAGTKLM